MESTTLSRWKRVATVVFAIAALVFTVWNVSGTANATPITSHPQAPASHHPATRQDRAVSPATGKSAVHAPQVTGESIDITGLDLHDGMVYQDGGTYYVVGTMYYCGYKWGDATTHWCGFGVVSAPSLSGPWSAITTLVSPTDTDPWSGRTWDAQCIRGNGGGCFNPRMVQRSDGVWILWFNAVGDFSYDHANAYNVMGCDGPAGPCGPGAPLHGSFNKPAAYTCAAANGDYSIFVNGSTAYLVCTGANRAEYVEQLSSWWTDGTGNIAGHGSSALFSDVEGAAIYHDTTSGLYIMVLSHPECGYCTGVRAIYGTSPNPIGPWSSPHGAEASPHGGSTNGPDGARNEVDGNSCGGQPRTIVYLDGKYYLWIDLWLGQQNETNATIHLEQLIFNNPPDTYAVPWQPFTAFSCA